LGHGQRVGPQDRRQLTLQDEIGLTRRRALRRGDGTLKRRTRAGRRGQPIDQQPLERVPCCCGCSGVRAVDFLECLRRHGHGPHHGLARGQAALEAGGLVGAVVQGGHEIRYRRTHCGRLAYFQPNSISNLASDPMFGAQLRRLT
jgi:hypothetical protein